MKIVAIIIAVLCAGSLGAQCPTPGALCDGVVEPSVEDFWEKWNSSDIVVYAAPILSEASMFGFGVFSVGEPEPTVEKFDLITFQVWKGPLVSPVSQVSSTWGYNLWDCIGIPPNLPEGSCAYEPEPCALQVTDLEPQVLFLRLIGGQWSTFQCFGTNVYDLNWLETEVVEPVSVTSTSWSELKATFR